MISTKTQQVVFLDRDGILVDVVFDGGRLVTCRNIKEVSILNGVKEALVGFKKAGYILLVVTNQPNIARGEMTKDDTEKIHNHLKYNLGLPIDNFYYCPHDDGEAECDCKKPKLGMATRLAKEDFPDINFSKSYMIGDRSGDMEFGRQLGCSTILISTAATTWGGAVKPQADYEVSNLSEALSIILNRLNI
ncbi:MAG: hypothetical protein A2589_02260 [Candidatus Vogelbacteria bacterium RIFOXYD1_FULL_46_19]|uniref:D,D-heptose 1,7-bisphosphate phosphatase n=1 Tax=Candidatus Vogelbacteria bacterium RIFOXYD1_FULL_46_19 TaxID=1802439 RepID=A0A1G2QGW3_9BACT|nr:MAG: hypothetical protein A2589_02260 [Candidatus Vogelbacteria bacterium RIFOXYD1_FULL_46_19]